MRSYTSPSSVFGIAFLAASVRAATINVAVGQDGLVFTPNSATAAVGDNLLFTFHGSIHSSTVAMEGLSAPCAAMGGLDSGIMQNGATFSIPVTSTDPMFIFCEPHCSVGMVFVANPTATDSVATYISVAEGGPVPPAASSSAVATTTSAAPTTTSAAPTTTSAAPTTTSAAPTTTAAATTTAPSSASAVSTTPAPTTSKSGATVKAASLAAGALSMAALVFGTLV